MRDTLLRMMATPRGHNDDANNDHNNGEEDEDDYDHDDLANDHDLRTDDNDDDDDYSDDDDDYSDEADDVHVNCCCRQYRSSQARRAPAVRRMRVSPDRRGNGSSCTICPIPG